MTVVVFLNQSYYNFNITMKNNNGYEINIFLTFSYKYAIVIKIKNILKLIKINNMNFNKFIYKLSNYY